MATISELRRQNEILRNQLQAKSELLKIQRERNNLIRENRALALQSKYPGLKRFASKSTALGKKAGTGFYKWAKMVAEAEERNSKTKYKKRR